MSSWGENFFSFKKCSNIDFQLEMGTAVGVQTLSLKKPIK
jgi:hypothetical protein